MPLTVLLHGDAHANQQARLGLTLAARGHFVVVCAAPKIAAQVRERFPDRCAELSLPTWLPLPLLRPWMRRRARDLRVDVVHLNFVNPRQEVWLGTLPYVATAWGSDVNDEVLKKTPGEKRSIDRILAGASSITADSPVLLDKVRARVGSPRPHDELVLWGVDRALFDVDKAREGAARMRAALGIREGQKVLLSPRQNTPRYHVDRILRAYADSALRSSGVMVVKMHGRADDAEHRANLERFARELGVSDHVLFAPPCPYEDVPGVYAMADVAVSALEVDGGPSTFCELFALGVPLVTTDLPAYRGIVTSEENALAVPVGDHEAMVRAIDRMATEPDLASRLSAGARVWADENADWERCVDRWEALYRRAIAGKTLA